MSGVANGSHPVGHASGPPLASAFPSPFKSTTRTSVDVPRAGHPPTSLIFVATDAVSGVPSPSKSAEMLRTSHTGNPSPISAIAGAGVAVTGSGCHENPNTPASRIVTGLSRMGSKPCRT